MEYSAESYLGVDIVKSGSKLSDFIYFAALIRDGSLVKIDEVSASRLIRILWELKPSVLAVDNLLELGGSIKNVSNFIKLIPPGVRIVQVNVDEKSLRDLRVAAKQAGLEVPHGKLDSKLSAVVIALLASKGFGKEIEVFSKKVKIYVHRGRSGRAGGSSASRFKRNLRASVAQVVRKVEETLKANSIEYDLTLRRSKGGVDSAVFTAYCDRERLYGLIKNLRGHDVVVRVRPVVSLSSIKQILHQEQEQKYLIVGLDPGIEVGVAVLDLGGRLIMLKSARGLDREDVVALLRGLGRVVIVATDKQQPPEFIRKVAATVGAKVYSPERNLSVYEKESIARSYAALYGFEVKDNHTRDSLAAAVEAYRSVERKIRELEEELSEMDLDRSLVNLEKYRVKIVEGLPVAAVIEEIIAEALSSGESTDKVLEAVHEAKALAEVNELMRKKIRELERTVESLEIERQQLLSRIKTLEGELSKMRSLLESGLASVSRELMRDRKVYELTQRMINAVRDLDNLRFEYERTREHYTKLLALLPSVAEGRLIVIRKIRTIEQLENLRELKQGELVFVENLAVENLEKFSQLIEKLEIRLVLPTSFPDDYLVRVVNDVAIPAIKEVDYSSVEDIAIVNSEVRSKIVEVVERVREIRKARERRERELTLHDLEEIIREYRRVREEAENSEKRASPS
ncbi:MAG: DUF460 domain-containing protein [Sulfolobales archaeon]|nr:DUF460 domain-containing protein [Sulfolobales archaeon]MDW8082183.1 DUF460 domain-containing protein [Sulfolobales archaeon]